MASFVATVPTAAAEPFTSAQATFEVTELASGLHYPWSIVQLPDGDLLVSEREGGLRRVHLDDGKAMLTTLTGLPDITQAGQGGLMGLALHPDFEQNHRLYFAHVAGERGKYGTEVSFATLEGNGLQNVTRIFVAEPKADGGRHFGGRLLFGADGKLYISLGERGASPGLGARHPAQQKSNHLGALIRINDDGSVPTDNPFVDDAQAAPEINSYGHRNIQGLIQDPATGTLWTHEHGPQGGDELNVEVAGANYGWPVITYGVNYGIGTRIGEGTARAGMEQPVYRWIPSIAPSGMSLYNGDAFPQWRGDIFIGSLKFATLVRLEMSNGTVVDEERLLTGKYGRIRDVFTARDGCIYLLTDALNGRLLRLAPRNQP
ncbi:MAG: PQQ-dependent sugar dehydrogenase [Gammaproteobacteria bacterium]|nr:PQQ-dependent sugar dehydrogenase [Gammaproteobacteria bacterium]